VEQAAGAESGKATSGIFHVSSRPACRRVYQSGCGIREGPLDPCGACRPSTVELAGAPACGTPPVKRHLGKHAKPTIGIFGKQPWWPGRGAETPRHREIPRGSSTGAIHGRHMPIRDARPRYLSRRSNTGSRWVSAPMSHLVATQLIRPEMTSCLRDRRTSHPSKTAASPRP